MLRVKSWHVLFCYDQRTASPGSRVLESPVQLRCRYEVLKARVALSVLHCWENCSTELLLWYLHQQQLYSACKGESTPKAFPLVCWTAADWIPFLNYIFAQV